MIFYFNPRAPRGARLSITPRGVISSDYFNPRAPRGARLPAAVDLVHNPVISIHALREERDDTAITGPAATKRISIHALREERDPPPLFVKVLFVQFQSTRSARSATSPAPIPLLLNMDFNPRAPRGARLRFLHGLKVVYRISIHALREERDATLHQPPKHVQDFNPRAPRGARRTAITGRTPTKRFQSTRSARSATSFQRVRPQSRRFQSTRSARSATCLTFPRTQSGSDFNPRAPRGARRALAHG